MDLHVRLDGRGDLSGQIYRQVRTAILTGLLPAGRPLPPTRELAGDLGVARNTVSMAYDRLVAEGFLTARSGVGTFVAGGLAQDRPAGDDGDQVTLAARPVWAAMSEPSRTPGTRSPASCSRRPATPSSPSRSTTRAWWSTRSPTPHGWST